VNIKKNIKNKLLILAGTISLGLGILGIILPILPTTPFLLITSACYIRSSKKRHDWLLRNKIFGKYLINYIEGKGMKLRDKAVSIIMLWLTIGVSVIFLINNIYVKIIILFTRFSVL